MLYEGLGQLESQPDSGQLLERIVADQRRDDERLGKLGSRLMVVNDDHVHTGIAGMLERFASTDTTIDSDQEARASRDDRLDCFPSDAVTIAETVGEMARNPGSQVPEDLYEQDSRSDPVNVVITMNTDFLAGPYSRSYAVADGDHVRKEEGVVEMSFGGEELAGCFRFSVASPCQDGCCYIARAQGVGECSYSLKRDWYRMPSL